jgi:hypothetical protein
MSEWLCPTCGWMIDSPAHELGCPDGRGLRVVIDPGVFDEHADERVAKLAEGQPWQP